MNPTSDMSEQNLVCGTLIARMKKTHPLRPPCAFDFVFGWRWLIGLLPKNWTAFPSKSYT